MERASKSVWEMADTLPVKFTLAMVVGLGLGTAVSASPVTLPVVGTVSSLFVGAALVLVGGGAVFAIDRRSPSSDCGCGGDCGC